MRIARTLLVAFGLMSSGANAAPSKLEQISNAITELDVERAAQLLQTVNGDLPAVASERGRLALYRADCDSAQAILSAPAVSSSPQGAGLLELAKSCARATAGSVIIDDKPNGVWIRLQDEGDRAIVPALLRVIVPARAAVERDLGVEMPRPLRLDLVRDLFSLSALTGLPVAAAETTGTVAVARWGRVTMITPRATPLGYPWEDTLAHEITHLALSRSSRDNAPLWLQEGIAKREETRWREPRPLDETPSPDEVARVALLTGRSIGVDRLGPSIAMLPTPEAASTAFAEVTSFMRYWIAQNGDAALQLLLLDLKGTGDDPNVAMRSVTGYDLSTWIGRWQSHLKQQGGAGSLGPKRSAHEPRPDDVARRVRLSDLLWKRGHPQAAAALLDPIAEQSSDAAVRWRAARATLATGDVHRAAFQLGSLTELDVLHGAWQALHGRILRERGGVKESERAFDLGVAVDPYSEDVACEGFGRGEPSAPVPTDAERRALCLEARQIHRD